jgi:Flp pilus assembly pilin Flp
MHRDMSEAAEPRTEERGQTMVEYAVVLSVITIAIMVAIIGLGDTSAGLINKVVDVLR